MRPITDSEIDEVFELFARRWRRVPAMAEFDLSDGWREGTTTPMPFASLRVWPGGEAGVRLCVAAWDMDRARLERLRDHLPALFADGPLVWDGVPLRGGEWGWVRLSDPNAGAVEDEDEWSPASVRDADGEGPVPGGFEPVRCQACHAVVMVPVNESAPVICPDCHALDESHAAAADDEPPFEPPPGPPHPPVHLLSAEARWWAPGHEPAKCY